MVINVKTSMSSYDIVIENNAINNINKYLDLPVGLLTGGGIIELQSNEKALIDCKCTVLQYTEEEIKINTGSGIIAFFGTNLKLDSLSTDSACISGQIKTLEFQN